jgi:hypothetical protein
MAVVTRSLMIRYSFAIRLLDSPSEPVTESNQRGPVAQSERDLAGLLVDRGIWINLACSLDDFDAAHGTISPLNARIVIWFPFEQGYPEKFVGGSTTRALAWVDLLFTTCPRDCP